MNTIDIFADDVIETANHFCYMDTALPEEVADKNEGLADGIQRQRRKRLFEDILDFHMKF